MATYVPSSTDTLPAVRQTPASLRLLPLLLGPLLLLTPLPAFGQAFGQWWWTAALRARQQIDETSTGGSGSTRSNITEFGLAGAVNGFLGHPALGDFGLDLDLITRNSHGTQGFDRDRASYGARFNLLPRGTVPVSFFARRRHFNDGDQGDGGLPSSSRRPEAAVMWGGNAKVQRGVFRGLQLQVDHTNTDFADATSQSHDRQRLGWSHGGRRLQNVLELRHLKRVYGVSNTSFEDISASLSQHAVLTPTWNWSLSGTAYRRDVQTTSAPSQLFGSGQLAASASHQIHQRDTLTIRAVAGQIVAGQEQRTESYEFATDYSRKLGLSWYLTPSIIFTRLSQETTSLRSARARLMVSWNRRAGRFDSSLSGTTSFGLIDASGTVPTSDERQLGLSFSGTLGHGDSRGLRKELELGVSRNELRFTADPIEDLPDLELPRDGLSRQDHQRARLTLIHAWGQRSVNGWLDWRHAGSSGDLGPADFETQDYTGNLVYESRNLQLLGSFGQVVNDREGEETRRVRRASASAFWRPTRFLNLRASYRDDKRMTSFLPDLDGTSAQAWATLHIGLFDVSAGVSQWTNDLNGETATTRRNYLWTISRRFGGILPISTGTRRMGVIR